MANAPKLFNAGTGQAINGTEAITLRNVTLTAAAADATLTIYQETNIVAIVLAAKAGTSESYAVQSVPHTPLPGPVVLDVVGVGAKARLDF